MDSGALPWLYFSLQEKIASFFLKGSLAAGSGSVSAATYNVAVYKY